MFGTDLFSKLGFTPNEVKVYLLLAEMGKSTAHLLAKRASIPRTTMYSVLESLVQKGLVSEEKNQGGAFFVVGKPTALLRLIEKEQQALDQRHDAAARLVELIKPYFKSRFFSVPRFQFFEGKAAVETMLYDQLEVWRASMFATDGVWWGYQDHTFVEKYRKWLEHYWSVKTDEEKVYLLSNVTSVEQELRGIVAGRIIKPVSERYDFSSSIWVCGNYIVLLMSRHEPNYAFQIQDAVFASNLRLLFALLWDKVPLPS